MATAAPRLAGRPTTSIGDRLAGLVEPALRLWTGAVYGFLFLPIVFVIVFSFNASRLVAVWGGFSFKWYGSAWTDHAVLEALRTSLIVASINTVLAIVFGTLAAVGMARAGRRLRGVSEAMVDGTIVTPEIVIAISSLLFFVTINFDLGI